MGFPDNASWLRALGVAERLQLCQQSAGVSLTARDAETAGRELALWRAQAPFDEGDWFERRWSADGIAVEDLRAVLGTGEEQLQQLSRAQHRRPPSWLRELEEIWERWPAARRPPLLAPEGVAPRTFGLATLLHPLFCDARRQLREGIGTLLSVRGSSAPPFDRESIADQLHRSLAIQLLALASRPLVLELAIARRRGLLAGDTPERRFASFVERLGRDEVSTGILADYPVLARSALAAVRRWLESSCEMLGHLIDDEEQIRATVADGAEAGPVVGIEMGAGDTHRGGRSVAVLRFESGRGVVYKPRSLAIDAAFNDLLTWLNRRGAQPALHGVRVLDRGDHGWAELVEPAPCDSEEEVRRFYRRQGGILALLHALQATDLHLENLIAAGEHPMLVDLETLFHAHPPLPLAEQPDLAIIARAVDASVLRVGLLPYRNWSGEGFAGVDLSGLGGEAGQLTPDRVLQWDGAGTDEMTARRERMPMPGALNRPELSGAELSLLDYREDLVAGFEGQYRLLSRLREELLATDGPLAAFETVECRSVLRPTRTYSLLSFEAQHPDMLRDALERERFLDRLWVAVGGAPYLERVVAAERADLMAGDIPYFRSRPGSRALWTSTGLRLDDFWSESGLAAARRCIASLSESDLARQRWFIQASMATLTLNQADLQWPTYTVTTPDPVPAGAVDLRRDLLRHAEAVGDQLLGQAWREGDHLAWVGLSFSEEQWGLVPLLDDLYGGVTGVIHFLAHLGELTGQRRFRDAAQAAVTTFRERLRSTGALLGSPGAFNGVGGILYGLAHWSLLWKDPTLFRVADPLIARLPGLIDRDDQFDVVGGCAGLLACLLAVQDSHPDERFVALARQCGDHLLDHARAMPEGVGWFSRIETVEPITGFSHGVAGISWALFLLAAATGDERYAECALAGVRHEHTRLRRSAGNWEDPTDTTGGDSTTGSRDESLSLAWCYGAPGIGLARLRSLAACDHPLLREELDIALDTTLRRGFGRNHSLCHGDLGNLDFVLQAARILNSSELELARTEILARILASLEEHGPICGVPLGVESPALMNGLSGIGFGLLRQADPDRVPSVLTLEPAVERPAP